MKKQLLFLLAGLPALFTACGDNHFITDEAYRAAVENDLQTRQEQLANPELFAVFDGSREMTRREKEALEFLYAYMPLGDLTDYPAEFYLENIRSTFATREEMPWGKTIPEYIFRHFVLPVRVNNENMDSSRMVFYEELRDRVKGLSMEDAILEVNHWCHEKVIYTPSDSRTSSPLASVKTAYGRCGEESTFTVAALRSVGIPARQVYTPRWAHTDDNHAWVEAWADGKWYYLGACEPEPVLDMGWFDAPVKRAMLLHTKAFGRYEGPEDVMSVTDCFIEINVTSNYAPVAKGTVKVVDREGNAVKDADVEFKIYNYADYYTVLRAKSDDAGQAAITTGKGDLMVWASKDGRFGFTRLSVGKDEQPEIRLEYTGGAPFSTDIDIVPPVEAKAESRVTQQQRDANNVRLLEEDSIRNAYTATFMPREASDRLAASIGQDADKVWRHIEASRGNWDQIAAFLQEADPQRRELAMAILGAISAKDLRDTPAAVLADHLNGISADLPLTDFNIRYIINPRVGAELLSPYRSVLAGQLDPALVQAAASDPEQVVQWCRSIRVMDEQNPQNIPLQPAGVGKCRIADANSRNIYFVALCRTLGIPARIDGMTRKVQYFHNEEWINADLSGSGIESVTPKGKLMMRYTPTKTMNDPRYGTHFTVSKIEDGKLRTVNLRSAEGVRGPATWSNLFARPLTMDEGDYIVVSGTRMASGKVLGHIASFTIVPGKTTETTLVMRQDTEDLQVLGSINAEAMFRYADAAGKSLGEEQSILATTGRGYFVIAILGARQEPTNHALRDMAAQRAVLEGWGRQMILLFPNENQWKSYDSGEFPGLPANITYGVDTDGRIARMIAGALNLSSVNELPIFIIADTFGRVVFVSQGYRIGLGEQLAKTISQL